jgi:hypothetical protein
LYELWPNLEKLRSLHDYEKFFAGAMRPSPSTEKNGNRFGLNIQNWARGRRGSSKPVVAVKRCRKFTNPFMMTVAFGKNTSKIEHWKKAKSPCQLSRRLLRL